MIAGDMEIRLRADIARLQRDMDRARQTVNNATEAMSRAANTAKNALAGIASGLGIAQFVQMTDQYTKFTAQLRLATTSTREYAAAYADVKRISTSAQQDLMTTGILYARIANGTRELGTSQKQVAAITETVNMALAVSGATATEAASAQLQLSQAFASGTLRGEEFNAVNEAAPRLMLALADGIGVPVGALKKMAEEGKITSKIMSDVLPLALAELREEAKQVATISGAFTVLKNKLVEFTGQAAHSNGIVAALTTSIGMLASNLGLLLGLALTAGAAKLSTMLATWTAETYRKIAADRAAVVATLATANANVQAAASASALATARMAEVRAATLAATGAVQVQIAVNGLIPAQARAAAAAATHTAALTAQAAAMRAASVTGGALRGVLAFLGGPIGAVIALLGVAATAWMVWGNKAKEGNELAKESAVDASNVIIAELDKQIAKNERVIGLRKQGISLDKVDKTIRNNNALGALGNEMVAINNGQGPNGERLSSGEQFFARKKVLERILELQEKINKEETSSAAAKALTQGEARVKFMSEYANKQEQMNAKLKEARELLGTQFTAEDEARIRKHYAEKTTGAKQEASAYANLVASIGEKIAANKLELAGTDKLTDSQKMTIKLDEAIASGKNKLNAQHIESARTMIAELDLQERAVKSRNQILESQEEMAKAQAEYAVALGKSVADANKEAEANEELVRTFGMSKTAIELMTIARLEEKLVRIEAIDGAHDEAAALALVIEARKRSAAAMGSVEALEAGKKLADDNLAAQKSMWESIDKTAHDTFISIFDSGKSAFDRLRDTLKNGLLDMLYQMTIKKWILNISANASSSGGIMGALSAGGEGGGMGSAMNLLSMGKTLYTGFAGSFASGMGTMIGNLGSMFGSATLSSFGSGMAGSMVGTAAGMGPTVAGSATGIGSIGTGAGAVGSSAAAAIPVVGWIAAGMALTNSLFKQGWDATNGSLSKTGQILGSGILALNSGLQKLGMSEKLANIFSGQATISKLFGRKNPEVENFGIEGRFGAGGFDGKAYQDILEKGGIFRSDKRYTNSSALDAGTEGSFDDTIKNLMMSVKGFGEVMGIEAKQIDGYTKDIKLVLTKDEAKNQELIAGLFGDIGNDLATLLIPTIADLGVKGETAAATLQRLATNYQAVDLVLESYGETFGQVGMSSLAARERLVSLSGGLEAFGNGAQFFAQTFMSEAERLAPVQKQVTEEMARLGLASVDTREEFKDIVLGLDLTTEQGAKTYASLMGVQEAFAMVTPAVEAVGAAAMSLADIMSQRRSLQDQLDELTMTEIQLREKARLGIAESNRDLFDQIIAARAAKEASEAAAQAAKDASDAAAQALKDLFAKLNANLTTIGTARAGIASRSFDARLSGQDMAGQVAMLSAAESELWSKVGTGIESAELLAKIESLAMKRIGIEDQMHTATIAGLKEQYDVRKQGLTVELDAMVKMRDFSEKMSGFANGLKLGSLSALAPQAKLGEAERQYRDTLARARGGDISAQGDFQNIATTYAELQKQFSGSTVGYASVINQIIADAESFSASSPTEIQIENQRLQISTIESTSSTITTAVRDTGARQEALLARLDEAYARMEEATKAQITQAGAVGTEVVGALQATNAKLAAIEDRMARMEGVA